MNEGLTKDELYARMQEQFKENAKLPWRWEWRYAAALALLRIGRPVDFVKNTLRVTYAWLIRQDLVKFITLHEGTPYEYKRIVPTWTEQTV